MANRRGNSRSSDRFYSLSFQNHWELLLQTWNWKMLAPCLDRYSKSWQCIKNRDFANRGLFNQSYGFSMVMYGCKSWTIKKAECWNIDAFELFWRWLSRVPRTARSSNWNRREGGRAQHLKEFHTPRQSINLLESNGSKMAYKLPSTRPWSSISKLNDIPRGAMIGQGTKRPKYRWWPNFLYPFPQMVGIILPLISLWNYLAHKN